ncbi:MAG: hypothetical protein GTN57_02185 [Acidobacteria bacterium]|nr:hypothetical protein [Acidobacteriota bacterium]NIT09923.1 hypothetical protein [Acidobacteriota bacterium]
MNKKLAILTVFLLFAVPATAETVLVEAGRDATLIEDPDGARANGAGPALFAGRTSQSRNGIRRGLVFFDVAAAVPRNAVVEAVSLRLYHLGGNDSTRTIRVHRVLSDWSEGPSFAGGGGGAPSLPGDATWLHRHYADVSWVRPGGQFAGRPSAAAEVGPSGVYTWDGSAHLVQDVRLWSHVPARNFGWVLIGDEETPQNSKKLASREHPDAALRPRLEITYRLPGRP